jgi:hypothetical protein
MDHERHRQKQCFFEMKYREKEGISNAKGELYSDMEI